jgi:hypothetical protein
MSKTTSNIPPISPITKVSLTYLALQNFFPFFCYSLISVENKSEIFDEKKIQSLIIIK